MRLFREEVGLQVSAVPRKKTKPADSGTISSLFCAPLVAYVLFFISFYLGVPDAANC